MESENDDSVLPFITCLIKFYSRMEKNWKEPVQLQAFDKFRAFEDCLIFGARKATFHCRIIWLAAILSWKHWPAKLGNVALGLVSASQRIPVEATWLCMVCITAPWALFAKKTSLSTVCSLIILYWHVLHARYSNRLQLAFQAVFRRTNMVVAVGWKDYH